MDIKELVDLCKKGNEQALSLLYKTYSKKMMGICLHYIPDKQIAQDLLHDGFIVIFTSIETLRTPRKTGKLDGNNYEEYFIKVSQPKEYKLCNSLI